MRILALAAHPDDETLGCGGTLLKHRDQGDSLFWLIATKAFEPAYSAADIQRKAEEVRKVSEAYGFEKTYELNLRTAALDTVPQVELIQKIQQAALDSRPDCVYVVNGSDVHSDHRILFQAAMSALKSFRSEFHALRILCYEALSSTDTALAQSSFVPNVFSDITKYFPGKIEILNLYQTEIQQDPLPRGPEAVRALARYRGASFGIEYAEAFMLVRDFF